MSYYVIKRDENLTAQLKVMFGDLVVDSFVAEEIYDDSFIPNDITHNHLSSLMQSSSELTSGELVEFHDASDVIVVFSNRKKVVFSNSEWFYLSELNIETKEL